MASLNGLSKWEIWELKQFQAKGSTDPKRPLDDSKDLRWYLILSTAGAGSDLVTCCPIQNLQKGTTLTEVELTSQSERFIKKPCKILCHEIYTLPDYYFTREIGQIFDTKTQAKILFSVSKYLGLK